MGKANRVKKELVEAVEMVDLIQTLKDIADNKFFSMVNEKDKFRRFGEIFVEFFRLIKLTDVSHPLIENDNEKACILTVTAEGSFLGEFNNKIIRFAISESEKYKDVKFVIMGEKGAERIKYKLPNADIKLFTNMENEGIYEMAIKIKDYLVDQVMTNQFGKVIVCYSWPKSFEMQKPRRVKLLPCSELLSKQADLFMDIEKVIEESDPVEIIGYLSNIWITTRLYEIFIDTVIASSAAQSQFLDDSVDKMKKERKKIAMKFRKAKKNDIDKSLRETFSARMMAMK